MEMEDESKACIQGTKKSERNQFTHQGASPFWGYRYQFGIVGELTTGEIKTHKTVGYLGNLRKGGYARKSMLIQTIRSITIK